MKQRRMGPTSLKVSSSWEVVKEKGKLETNTVAGQCSLCWPSFNFLFFPISNLLCFWVIGGERMEPEVLLLVAESRGFKLRAYWSNQRLIRLLLFVLVGAGRVILDFLGILLLGLCTYSCTNKSCLKLLTTWYRLRNVLSLSLIIYKNSCWETHRLIHQSHVCDLGQIQMYFFVGYGIVMLYFLGFFLIATLFEYNFQCIF